MKIFLTAILCSSVASTCLPPHTFPNGYVDHCECLLEGYEKSIDKLMEMGRYDVNTHGIYIKFDCREIIVPLPKPKLGEPT